VSFAYDEVPYPGLPLAQTHPDRLATLARLFGMVPAHPERCRVLELGCGDGGNLIPMALMLPASEFTGIDLAEPAIAQGCSVVDALALRNITLRRLDLMRVGADLGEFDYIMAHGVYSWVPAEVRDRLLSVCRAHLGPRGVAYISYNARPGFRRRLMFREMMLYHVRNVEDPLARVKQAIRFIESLAKLRPENERARAMFAEQLQHVSECEPGFIYHDDLASDNYAPYFHEFMAHAQRHRLAYLAEADFLEMQDDIYPEPVTEALQRFAGQDVVLKEQYLDFVKGRRFRQTLLCREEAVLDRRTRPEQITELYLASAARPVSPEPDPRAGVFEEFRGRQGAALKTDDPPAKAALLHLAGIWPRRLRFGELQAVAGGDPASLAEILFQAYRIGLLEVHSLPPNFAARAGERPAASPLARLQAQRSALVTTLRHTTEELDDTVDRCLLFLLDGTRNREVLVEELAALLQSLAQPGADSVNAESLEMRLGRLAKQALLLA
jgi:SAM-dependent methyltransferase